MALSLPWLLLLGLSLPVALAVPLLFELRHGHDVGPRQFPTRTLDPSRKPNRTTKRRRAAEDPDVLPGLARLAVDVEVIAGTETEGNLVTKGHLTIGRAASLKGSAKALRGVHVLDEGRAYGNLVSGGEVVLERLSYVQGIVYASGNVILKPGAAVKGIYTDGRVDIYPGAEILEDVIARDGVHLVVPEGESQVLEELEALNAVLRPERLTEGDT